MKYSHFLNLMKESSAPDKEQIYNKIISQKSSSWVKVVAIVCAAVLILGLLGTGTYFGLGAIKLGRDNHLPENLKGISPITAITATDTKGDTVSQHTAFEITTQSFHSVKDIYAMLKIEPQTDFKVKKTSGNTFDISFTKPLKENTLYKLYSTVGTKTVYSWAFQTETKFEITASCAGNAGFVHYLETGEIWVEFSRSDVKNFEQYFSITPAVSGTFEQYGKRWVFIPSSDFAKSTVYTVTISKDIISGDGQTLENDYSFNVFSRVGGVYADCASKTNDCDTFTTTQAPVAVIEYSGIDVSRAKVNVYRTGSSSTFIDVHSRYVKGSTISSAISNSFKKEAGISFDATLKTDAQNNRAYLTYPEPLETGYYVAQIMFGDVAVYHLFQVCDYAVYTTFANDTISVWVNDLNTKQPVADVSVADNYGDIKKTDTNGVALFECENENAFVYLNISTATPAVSVVKTKKTEASFATVDNYSFIRTDKTVYSAGDTVKIFGFTVPEERNTQRVYEIKASWADGAVEVIPDGDGAFNCELETAGIVADTNGYIDLIINGQLAKTVFVDVFASKPKYNIKISTDSDCYIQGETVTYNIYAELSDRTPAENVPITIDGQTLITNSRGLAVFTEAASAKDGNQVVRTFTCGEQSYFVDYTVFRDSVVITDVVENSDGTLDVYVNNVDKNEPDFIGAPADCDISAQMYIIDYVQNGSFSGYDAMNAQQVSDPTYTANSILQGSETAAAVNGVAKLTTFAFDHNAYYLIKADGDEYTYYPYGELSNGYSDTNRYSLQCKTECTVGETVIAKLCGNSPADIIAEGGKVIINFVSGGIVKSEVYDVGAISFEFSKEFAHGVIIDAAYFDGTSVHKVSGKALTQKQSALDIEITLDKQDYSPGDTVNMAIDVKGADRAAVEATVNVLLYDERFYIQNDTAHSKNKVISIANTASSYSPSITGNRAQPALSYKNANNGYTASPCFETVKTDIAGHAQISFTLPENVAGWKADIIAFDKNAGSGQRTVDIKATSDMYIETFVSEKIYTGDDVSFAFRFDGDAVNGQCNYTAALFKDGIQIATKNGTASVQQVKNENFGKQAAGGNYTVKITGTNGALSCESEAAFVLTDKAELVTELVMQDSTDTQSGGYSSDITVNVYDIEYELYFKVIEKMLAKSSGRIDHILASTLAKSIVTGRSIEKNELSLISGCAGAQGINVYPNGTLAITPQAALIAVTADDLFDKNTVKGYFDGVLKKKPDTLSVIAANAVFAEMGEPVLCELNTLYDGFETYTDEQKLFLALGFACAGDYNRAYEILNSSLVLKIHTANGVSTFEADTPAATEYMSCIAAIVTSKLSQQNAKDLVKGLMNVSDSTLTGLAYCTFIKECVPYLEGKNTIIYKAADGSETQISYHRTESVTFNIERENIDKVSIISKSGENASCIASQKPIADSGYKQVSQKSSGVTLSNTNAADGDTVKIVMTIDTAGCDMSVPYAVLSLPHGLKLTEVLTTNASVCNERVYINGGTATLELSCYCAIEGNYSVFAPTVIDRDSKKIIAGNSAIINVN